MAGNFFIVSYPVLRNIARQTQWAECLLAYLVLAKHKQWNRNITSAGAWAIAQKLQMTRAKADEIVETLKRVSIGDNGENAVMEPGDWSKISREEVASRVRTFPAKVLPPCGDDTDMVALPNVLIDGLGKGMSQPPVVKMIKMDRDHRLDAVSLLLALYRHNRYADYGGINPACLSETWNAEGDAIDGLVYLGLKGRKRDNGIDWRFWVVSPEGRLRASDSFIEEATRGNGDALVRALEHLKDLNLIYRVAMVYDGDPLKSPQVEPLYPLFVYDRHIREKARQEGSGRGGLASEALNCLNRSCIASDEDPNYAIFSEHQITGSGSGLFVYAGQCDDCHVSTVYRLRYQPHTRDIVMGTEAEHDRLSVWKQRLHNAFR